MRFGHVVLNFCYQAIAQVCAFVSPFAVPMSEIEILQQLGLLQLFKVRKQFAT